MKKFLCPTTQKKRFPTEMHAEIRLLSLQKEIDHPLYTYQCYHCGGWHYTKQLDFIRLIHLHLRK